MGLNMSKTIYRTGLVILGSSFFISGIIFAQTYTGFGNGGSALPPRSSLNTVMSKDDFKSSVTSLGNQNQQAVKQQVIQSMPKTTITTPRRSMGYGGSTGSGTQTIQPQVPSYSTYSNQPSVQQPAQAAAPSQPAGGSGGIYTGFGGGTAAPSTPSKPASSGSESSGWNINY